MIRCKYVILTICLASLSQVNSAQGLKQWANKIATNQVSETQPSEGPYTGKVFNHTTADGKILTTGLEEFAGMSDETLFINAYLWMVNQSEKDRKELKGVDLAKMRLQFSKPLIEDENAKEMFESDMQIQISGNMISYTITDISQTVIGLLNSIKKTPLEKLSPDKKPKHAEIIASFDKLNSKRLATFFNYVKSNKPETVTHWEQISQNKICVGMNETECLLAIGKPWVTGKVGSRTRWTYANSVYVFFENGKVSNFIN